MEQENISFKELSSGDTAAIVSYAQQLNPAKSAEELTGYMHEMFAFANYHCFGVYQAAKLIGITSGWITVRFYSGKQIEIDNVIVGNEVRSAGVGKQFLAWIESWAKERSCKTVELNTYIQNSRSHKFYFSNRYSILGFHFQKNI